jgi:hypothetical protein
MSQTNAVLIYDRVVRGLLRSTLESRNHAALDRLTVALPDVTRGTQVRLQRPGGTAPNQPLDIGFVSESYRGTTIERLVDRGLYHIQLAGQRRGASQENRITLAVNGDERESDLSSLSTAAQAHSFASDKLRLFDSVQKIQGAGSNQLLWWQLAAAVLILLVCEMIVVAGGSLRSTHQHVGVQPLG